MTKMDYRKSLAAYERGFTLIEVLVTLALITIISLVVMGALQPWIGFKQKLDNERKLQDIRQGLLAYYRDNAMAIEAQPPQRIGPFVNSTVSGGRCTEQLSAFVNTINYFSESPDNLQRDGYANPWCIFVSPSLSVNVDGVPVWHRTIAFISPGPNGTLEAGTKMNVNGTITLDPDGDDQGILISGLDVQVSKLRETQKRMDRIASAYETYFTARYLANPARDIGVYYFSNAYDPTGEVASTGGSWRPVKTYLGFANSDGVSAWEGPQNSIEVANHNETETTSGIGVRSPATSGTGVLPYTALLRARIPAPAGQNLYVSRVVVGTY